MDGKAAKRAGESEDLSEQKGIETFEKRKLSKKETFAKVSHNLRGRKVPC